jgi:hypothetical protein
VYGDEKNNTVFQSALRKATASAKTYAALHLAMAGYSRKLVVQFLMNGLKDNPREMFRRRFFVVLKLILVK